MNALREECQQLRDELIALRREFHRAPELGLQRVVVVLTEVETGDDGLL